MSVCVVESLFQMPGVSWSPSSVPGAIEHI